MMVALLLYAYARGVRSSRVIERACVEDVAFRVIAAQQRAGSRDDRAVHRAPRGGAGRAVRRGAGALRGGRGWRGRGHRDRRDQGAGQREPRRQRGLRAVGARDHRGGQGDRCRRGRALRRRRGDELPEELSTAQGRAGGCARPSGAWRPSAPSGRSRCPRSRPERLQRGQAAPRRGAVASARPTRNTRPTAPGVMTRRRALRPRDPSPTPPPEHADREGINITDPDSRVVKSDARLIQGYNAQAACNEQQIVLAAEVMTASPDFGHLEPMVDAPRARTARRRRRPSARGRRRRRRLLASGQIERDHRRGHPGAHPARLQPPQAPTARLERRRLRLHARGLEDRARQTSTNAHS